MGIQQILLRDEKPVGVGSVDCIILEIMQPMLRILTHPEGPWGVIHLWWGVELVLTGLWGKYTIRSTGY